MTMQSRMISDQTALHQCIPLRPLSGVMLALLWFIATGSITAQTLTTVATFNGSNGSNPVGALVLDGDMLYGATTGHWGRGKAPLTEAASSAFP